MSRQPIQIVLFSEANSKFGYPFLQELLQHPEVIVKALVTSPVDKLCSYYILEPEAVDLVAAAEMNNVRVFRPNNVNAAEVCEQLSCLQADYFLIANYQQILREPILAIPKKGTLNFHPSPLPRYAGLAPFFWMAKQGERAGGVSCIRVTPQIDGGPLVEQLPVPLRGEETALEIRDLHFAESLRLLQVVLEQMLERSIEVKEQDMTQRTYFGKVQDSDLQIDWQQSSEQVLRTIRAGYRYPGAFTHTSDGERVVVLSADHALPPSAKWADTVAPGTVQQEREGVLVATGDGWIRVQTIEVDGQELEVKSIEQSYRMLNKKRWITT